MGAELETLFQLQELDLRLLEKQGEIDRYERRLSDRRKQLEQCSARVEELTNRRKQLITDRALAERKVSDAKDLLQDRRQRLARIRTERELRAGEGEIAGLAEEIDRLEEELLVVMEQVDEIEKELEDARAQVKDLEEADHQDIETESRRIEGLKSELASERAARDEIAAGLDPRVRRRYEMVLERRSGRAVVEVVGGACSGCHMQIPPQMVIEILSSGAIRVCPSCQRILYARE